jgi:hypothetical protein
MTIQSRTNYRHHLNVKEKEQEVVFLNRIDKLVDQKELADIQVYDEFGNLQFAILPNYKEIVFASTALTQEELNQFGYFGNTPVVYLNRGNQSSVVTEKSQIYARMSGYPDDGLIVIEDNVSSEKGIAAYTQILNTKIGSVMAGWSIPKEKDSSEALGSIIVYHNEAAQIRINGHHYYIIVRDDRVYLVNSEFTNDMEDQGERYSAILDKLEKIVVLTPTPERNPSLPIHRIRKDKDLFLK